MDRRLYRPREVAELLAVSRGEVYALISKGLIRSVRIAKAVRVSAQEVERLMTVGLTEEAVAESVAE